MPPNDDTASHTPDAQLTGTAREFAVFCKGERQRRANAEGDFDPVLFDAAVDYVLRQLTTQAREAGA